MSSKTLLQSNNLRITNTRQDVLDLFLNSNVAINQSDIELELDHIDRITLYRTLKTFEEKGIIHKIIDHTQRAKFALCAESCTDHKHDDSHVHFHCRKCGSTSCLMQVPTPSISLPLGYKGEVADLIVKGLCPNCTDTRI